jgi:hypothetical protein
VIARPRTDLGRETDLRASKRTLRNAAVLCLAVVALAALGASPAFAAKTRTYTGTSFGPDGIAGSATFKSLQSVAVDQSDGSVYVLDAGEGGKLYKFNAAGEAVNFSALGANVIEGVGGAEDPGTGAENQIAIAPPGAPGGTAGDIYLANNAFGTLSVYGANGEKAGGGVLETGGETCGVAADPAGHLFVGLFGSVVEYIPSANPPIAADQTATGTGENGSCNITVDGLGNIYASNFLGGSTAKLEGIADPTPTLIEPGGATLATDPATNDLYLDSGSSIAIYSSAGKREGQFGAAGLANSRGIAIGKSAEAAYLNNGATGQVDLYGPVLILADAVSEAATEIGPETATLNGTISAAGGPEASCEFQITTKEAFAKEGFTGASSLPCTPPGPFSGEGIEAVSAKAEGLATGTNYVFRVFASNENGPSPGAPKNLLTLGPSALTSGVKNITATAATVTGLIKPNGETTTYHVEYGPSESYGSSIPVPDASVQLPLASGKVDEEHPVQVRGVRFSQGTFAVGQEIESEAFPAGTVITKIEGTSTTPEGTESEPLSAGLTLTLSAGALEGFAGLEVTLSSPSAAISQRLTGLTPGTTYHFRIVATSSVTALGPDGTFTTFLGAVAGERAYELVSPAQKIGEAFAPEPLGNLGGSCTQVCLPGSRSTLGPMQARADGEALAYEGDPFTAGLSPAGNEYLAGRSGEGWANSAITPSSAPGIADGSGFRAFSADLSRGVLLQTSPALAAQAPLGGNGESFSNLYRWEAGNPALQPLVTVEPPNRDPGTPSQANAFQITFAGANAGAAGTPAFEHIVFEANDALSDEVPGTAPAAPEVGEGKCGGYPASDCDLYEWVGGQLRLVNVLPGNTAAASGAVIGSGRRLAGAPSSGAAAETQAADVDHAVSTDGRRIFWSDASGQVYVRVEGKETVKLNDSGQFLTATPDGSKVLLSDGCLYSLATAECEANLTASAAGFLGIMGASADLSRIYFVSPEALGEGAEARVCKATGSEEEQEGKVPVGFGCNLYAYENGTVSLIAALSEADNNFGENFNYGSWKAAQSNRTAQVGPDGLYLAFMSQTRLVGYDNRVAGGGGCRASAIGEPCLEVYEYDLEAGSLECASCNPSGQRPLGPSNLSLIRQPGAFKEGTPFPQPENLPGGGEGRLFFESQDALSPKDTNGRIQDVYEWRPDGVGGCARAGGCLALVSSGNSASDSMFLTATPDAKNAFFVTREQLLPQDEDELLDVYDARVGGGIGTGGIAPCSGEGCKGPIAPPPPPPPSGSSQFSGPGNQKPVHKKHHKRKHHKKRHHHKRAAGNQRGGAK